MDGHSTFELVSWLAGIIAAAIALITIIWQIYLVIKRTSRKGDWEVMRRTFHGVRIGAPIISLQTLGLNQIRREGSGAIKITKFLLDNGNELSVTYNSVQDRILYAEIDWTSETPGIDSGISGLKFGTSTLKDIRGKYASNGFTYAQHAMFMTKEGLIAFNAFELKKTPTIILVFVTKLSRASESLIQTLPEETQKEVINEYQRLDAIVVADEKYLDEIWGDHKLYDPKSRPIRL